MPLEIAMSQHEKLRNFVADVTRLAEGRELLAALVAEDEVPPTIGDIHRISDAYGGRVSNDTLSNLFAG